VPFGQIVSKLKSLAKLALGEITFHHFPASRRLQQMHSEAFVFIVLVCEYQKLPSILVCDLHVCVMEILPTISKVMMIYHQFKPIW
jgi:hypothetical protein